jgi:hypothetical protein
MTRRFTKLVALIGVFAFPVAVFADEPQYRYTKPIEMPAFSVDELFAVTLDDDVYSATRDNYPDIRVQSTDAAGDTSEVSYTLRRATTTKSETSRHFFAAKNPSIKTLPDDALEITLELDKNDPQPQGIRILTSLSNFEQRVRIFSSPDGKDWKPVGDEGVVFDYSQFMDVRNDTIPFPANTDRHFRIVIDNVTQELESQLMELTRRLQAGVEEHRDERLVIQRRPFRINHLEFWNDVEQHHVSGDLKAAYLVSNFKSENDTKEKQTLLTFDSRREPLTSLQLETKSKNFSRQIEVQVEHTSGKETSWQTIGSATISRLAFGKLNRDDVTITFPETRGEKYRIVIHNRSSAPLSIDGVTATGNQYQLVFLASPPAKMEGVEAKPANYELRYGSDTAAAPDYDVAAITASLSDGYQPKPVTLGKQIEVAIEPLADSFSPRKLLNDGRVLGGIAVVLVAALAWGLYHAGRRLDGIPNDHK